MQNNMEFLKKILSFVKEKKDILYLLAVVLIGLTPLLWFQGKLITGEEFYSLNYGTWGDLYSNAWGSHINYGVTSMWVPFKFQGYFFNFLNWLGIEYYFALVFWHSVLWISTGLFFYLLVNEVYKDKINKFILLIATVFYVYNPFFVNISVLLTPPRLLFIILPLEFYFLFKYLTASTNHVRYILILALLTLLFSPIYVNIPYASILFIPVFAFILYRGVVWKKYTSMFKHLFLYILLFSIFNAWWVVPTWWKTVPNTKDIKHVTSGFITIDRSPVSDVISYFGSWAFREKAGDDYYFPYHLSYDQFPLALVRYIPFALLVYVIYYFAKNPEKSERRKYLILVASLLWLSLFLAKGSSGAGGKIFEFLFKNVPGFWLYREPYAKFLPLAAVCGSLLLPIGITEISKLIPKHYERLKLLFYVTLMGTAFYIAYPIWMSLVIPKTNNPFSRSPVVELPDYWNKIASEWQVNNGYYLTFPSQAATETFLWPSGYSGSPFLLLKESKVLATPNFLLTNSYVDSTVSMLYDYMIHDPKRLVDVASQYRVGGIIFQGDTSYGDVSKKKEYFREKYPEYLAVSTEKVDIYDFKKDVSDVEIVSDRRVFDIAVANPMEYKAFKTALPANSILNYSDNPVDHDVYVLSPDTNNLASYNLDKIKPGKYLVQVRGDLNSINDIYLDNNEITLSDGFFSTGTIQNFTLEKNEICCKTFAIGIPEAPLEQIPNNWQYFRTPDTNALVHYIQMDPFDLENVFNIEVNMSEPLLSDTVFGITQVDTETGSNKNLGYGMVKAGNPKAAFTFAPSGALNTVLLPLYLLTLQPSAEVPVNVTSVNIAKIPYYSVVLTNLDKFSIDSPAVPEITDYKRITHSLATLRISGSQNATKNFLQFKEGYDPRWSLVKISDRQSALLNSNFIFRMFTALNLSMSGTSSKPGNFEGYSNAWLIPSGEDSSYALIYTPEYVVEILLLVSLLSASAVVVYIFKIKKND